MAEQTRQDQGSADTGTALAKPKEKTAPGLLPPYKVLLHNDETNDMLFVVEKVCELTPLSTEDAVEKMFEAHQTGVALLLVTHKERAELYCEQFATYQLDVTTELDD
jgi:ATP-dependent Clp protease adaptor protein ClpS